MAVTTVWTAFCSRRRVMLSAIFGHLEDAVCDKLVRYVDVPQDFDPEIGGVFYRHELEELAADLTARGANRLDSEGLRRAIGVYNENRRQVRQLYELRRAQPVEGADTRIVSSASRRDGAARLSSTPRCWRRTAPRWSQTLSVGRWTRHACC